jgi:hypothetical protein
MFMTETTVGALTPVQIDATEGAALVLGQWGMRYDDLAATARARVLDAIMAGNKRLAMREAAWGSRDAKALKAAQVRA